MIEARANLYIGNIIDKDHIQDWISLFKQTLGDDNLQISDRLDPEHPNIILEEFSEQKHVDEIRNFKLRYPNTKIIVFLTEFLNEEKFYINSFSSEYEIISKIYNQEFLNPVFNKLCAIIKHLINFFVIFIKIYNKIIKKFISFIPNIDRYLFLTSTSNSILFKIKYFSSRLNNLLEITNSVDFFLCGYKEQINGWSKYIKKDIIIFPYLISEDSFKLMKKKQNKNIVTYGSISNFRKKAISYLHDFGVKIINNNSFLSSKDLKDILQSYSFFLFIPNEEKNTYTSSLKSWYSINNGCIPINYQCEKQTYFEKILEIPMVKSYEIERLKEILENKEEYVLKFQTNYKNYIEVHDNLAKEFFYKLNENR
jgi:hypothetical protein